MTATNTEPSVRPAARPKAMPGDAFGGAIPMALASLAIVGVGFFPTFFSRLGEVDPRHLLHAAISIGWLVLVLVQALLVRSRRFKWHRWLGWASTVLFAILIVTTMQMIALMLNGHRPMPFESAKLFGYSDVMTLPLFVILYVSAIVLRKDRHVHSRLISITMLVGIIPALARTFFFVPVMIARQPPAFPDGLAAAMHPTYVSLLLVLGIAMFLDWRKQQLRWPFPFAFAWLALTYATMFPGWRSDWFDGLARAIGAFG